MTSNPIDINTLLPSGPIAPRHLIPSLQKIQDTLHYIPAQAFDVLAKKSGFSIAHIKGVATFYRSFRLTPAGEHRIKVCIGTACHLAGATQIFNTFKRQLNIPSDKDTDSAGKFTVETVACLGCCMLAPVVQIDEKIYGHVEQSMVPGVLEDFLASRNQTGKTQKQNTNKAEATDYTVRTCLCSGCQAAGSPALLTTARDYASKWHLQIKVAGSRCQGLSHTAPILDIHKNGRDFRYLNVSQQDIATILRHAFPPANVTGRLIQSAGIFLEKLTLSQTAQTKKPVGDDYIPDNGRMATSGNIHTNPVAIDEYMKEDGFKVINLVVDVLPPEEVISIIQNSGLRGRGGAGYPTGDKWDTVFNAPGSDKYIICNGDEGDPGAFMDRMLLECYPYKVIEGILLAAYALGAKRAYCYIRAEYAFAIEQMKKAIKICEDKSLLGKKGRLNLEVITGAGAFVCGEETALIKALQGERGMPVLRPPYPAQKGLNGSPTLINNVETFALIPGILGGTKPLFHTVGTKTSKGTKVFALAGKVKRGGLIEVPMGTTIHHIVEQIGGGTPSGTPWKAVQMGGPSGGCVPFSQGHTPIDYSGLQALGSMMGSGGIVVMDSTDCMVDIARYFLSFTRDESCGKCTFCRLGTSRMLKLLNDLCEGRASAQTLDELKHLATQTASASLCGLGRTSPNPVISTLRWFPEEYQAHIQGRCPSGKCAALIQLEVNDNCIGCTRCAQQCPVDAIAFTPLENHYIDPEKCIRCGACESTCPSHAIDRVTRGNLQPAEDV